MSNAIQEQQPKAIVSGVLCIEFEVNDPYTIAQQIAAGCDCGLVRSEEPQGSMLLECGSVILCLRPAHGNRQGVSGIEFGVMQPMGVSHLVDGISILGVRHSFRWVRSDSAPGMAPIHGVCVDHIAVCVARGQLTDVVNEYRRSLGLECAQGEYAMLKAEGGLSSVCLVSRDGKVMIPIVEADGRENHVAAYVNERGDGGVQHVALRTGDIVGMCGRMAAAGVSFMRPRRKYYDDMHSCIHALGYDVNELERYGIVVDSDKRGRLLQTFTAPLAGDRGAFLEIVQRDGVGGFSSRNASALYDAAETHIRSH